MSSLTRYVGAPITSAYATTKAGMEAMSTSARLELAPWNVAFWVVVPGFVDAPTFDVSRAAGRSDRDDPSNPYRSLLLRLDSLAAGVFRALPSAWAHAALRRVYGWG